MTIGILSSVLQGRFFEEDFFEFSHIFKVRIGSFWEIPRFFENQKEPQRSHESFGGSIASRSLICVGKQPIEYSVQTPSGGDDDGDGGGDGRIL